MTPTTQTCPAFGDRVAVDLPHGTTLFGRARGCVFGDCSAAHEHFVAVDTAIWEDGSVHRGFSGQAGKFWSVRSLSAAEVAAEAREAAFALSLVD